MSSIECVNFMARSGLRTWTWMTRCRSTNDPKFIPMQPNVVGLVAGRGGENLKRLKQLPDVDSIEVYTNDADGQFEGRIHKQAGAHDRKWIIMEVKVGRLRMFHVRYSASFRVEMYIQYVYGGLEAFFIVQFASSQMFSQVWWSLLLPGHFNESRGKCGKSNIDSGYSFQSFFKLIYSY